LRGRTPNALNKGEIKPYADRWGSSSSTGRWTQARVWVLPLPMTALRRAVR